MTKRPRRISEGTSLVLLTDGLKEYDDLNHKTGVNVLRGDGGVHYVNSPKIAQLVFNSTQSAIRSVSSFNELWDLISGMPNQISTAARD